MRALLKVLELIFTDFGKLAEVVKTSLADEKISLGNLFAVWRATIHSRLLMALILLVILLLSRLISSEWRSQNIRVYSIFEMTVAAAVIVLVFPWDWLFATGPSSLTIWSATALSGAFCFVVEGVVSWTRAATKPLA